MSDKPTVPTDAELRVMADPPMYLVTSIERFRSLQRVRELTAAAYEQRIAELEAKLKAAKEIK